MKKPLLKIEHLTIHYVQSELKEACCDISFSLFHNERVGIVGESGCGKTTLLRSINGMLSESARISKGNITFNEEPLFDISEARWNQLRKTDIAMVFQDAMNSLNPSKTIGCQMIELIRHVQKVSKSQAKEKMKSSLLDVGLLHVEEILKKYPFELSGGMLQRVSLAMSFLSTPKLILADEPTSSLDVLSAHHVLTLLNHYTKTHSSALIMATHHLDVIAAITDRVIVMYAGRIVEMGKTDEVLKNSCHPYTRKLLCSMILLDESTCCQSHHHMDKVIADAPTDGCSFYVECTKRQPRCIIEHPMLTEIHPNRKVACFYATQG